MAVAENFGFRGVDGIVKKFAKEPPVGLGSRQVLIRITHASLCSTELHYIPHGLALGHEGVGIVERLGDAVTRFELGDRVGIGYQRDVSPYHIILLPSFFWKVSG